MMRARKKAGLWLIGLALLVLVSACGPGTKAPAPCAAVLAAVEQSQSFSELVPLSGKLVAKYLDLDLSLVSDSAMAMDGTRVTAEQIVVLTATNAKALETVQAALTAYLAGILLQYRDYQPDEVPKLENAVLQTSGLQIALIVSADWAVAKAALDKAWE